ncbi:BA14K family protein [Agrobacterium bohemicum]|uniref:BA14K family protein n=1 Tax=Agrobacterium bohemicum TaxID=2052828 RepID=UPI001FD96BA2|nr:BA14K family protein [Agrobacterium bohemicum]
MDFLESKNLRPSFIFLALQHPMVLSTPNFNNLVFSGTKATQVTLVFRIEKKELPMSRMVKLISLVVLSVGLSATTSIPAHALSIIAPAYEGQAGTQGTYDHPPVAFTGGSSDAGNSSGLSLSSHEILHVKWCAQNYPSYHATDNTYQIKHGARTECRSPY